MRYSLCRSKRCGAKITWAIAADDDRRLIPLDSEPVVGGTYAVEERGPDLIAEDLPETEVGKVLGYVSHLTTCPDRDNWRALVAK